MKKQKIALVTGDGSAPEMMAQATRIVAKAAELDGIEIEFVNTPMGWNAFERFGDTVPEQSLKMAREMRLVFFGGVGDENNFTDGKQMPYMMPETKINSVIKDSWWMLERYYPTIFLARLQQPAESRINKKIVTASQYTFWSETSRVDTRADYFEMDYALPNSKIARVNSLGLMSSSAINPDNAMALFQSGAGTVPDLRGQNKANPIGRILAGARMLNWIGARKGEGAIMYAVATTLEEKIVTHDLLPTMKLEDLMNSGIRVVGTKEMGDEIFARL